jgi:putative transferase (TIGR04331 family)
VPHGGGLKMKLQPYFEIFQKISYQYIAWEHDEQNKNLVHLSPTIPILKLKDPKSGDYCTIVFVEQPKYTPKLTSGPTFTQSMSLFNELTQFINKLDPEIKSKVKYRVKSSRNFYSEKKFLQIFGEKNIDKVSFKNPFMKTILNSKLIIVTYPQTAFSEAMYSNIPTILIIKTDYIQLAESALHTFNVLKKNQIAFDNFNEAQIHINKYWNNLDLWWKSKNVQAARKIFLTNFFNVKANWFREWSDYIYFLQNSHDVKN